MAWPICLSRSSLVPARRSKYPAIPHISWHPWAVQSDVLAFSPATRRGHGWGRLNIWHHRRKSLRNYCRPAAAPVPAAAQDREDVEGPQAQQTSPERQAAQKAMTAGQPAQCRRHRGGQAGQGGKAVGGRSPVPCRRRMAAADSKRARRSEAVEIGRGEQLRRHRWRAPDELLQDRADPRGVTGHGGGEIRHRAGARRPTPRARNRRRGAPPRPDRQRHR